MADKIPDYAFNPLRRCLDSIFIMRRLLELSIEGLHMVSGMPELLEKVSSISKQKDDSTHANYQRSVEAAIFARNERDQGFPNLHAYTLVSTWGALEAGIEDMLVAVLVNEPQILSREEFAKARVPLAKFEQLEKEERMRFLLTEVQRAENSGLAQGVATFEKVLRAFDLSGSVDTAIKDALWEMNHIRNVLVHRDSRADLRLVQACPWINLKVGERVFINHDRYSFFSQGVIDYVRLLVRRLGTRYDATPPSWAIPIVMPGVSTTPIADKKD